VAPVEDRTIHALRSPATNKVLGKVSRPGERETCQDSPKCRKGIWWPQAARATPQTWWPPRRGQPPTLQRAIKCAMAGTRYAGQSWSVQFSHRVSRSEPIAAVHAKLADPSDCLNFERCKLDLPERGRRLRFVREALNHLGRRAGVEPAGLALRDGAANRYVFRLPRLLWPPLGPIERDSRRRFLTRPISTGLP
jgi:hypothetical protein